MNRNPWKTAAIFSALVFSILAVTMLLSILFIMLLFHLGLLEDRHMRIPISVFAIVSIIVGTILSQFAGKRPIGKIAEISEATKEIAKGNFDVKLDENIPVAEFKEMARSFNIMTRELAGTEILRNDFIANVSHEFKTPLAAIEGYATLLQKPHLPEEKRLEYTARIIYNTKRLSALTGNILLLSKLENQEIGVERELYCLDEQLRETILLFEDQWTRKNLELDIDLESADYFGSRELLAQVWQNILENAIKFAPVRGQIRIALRWEAALRQGQSVKVDITDNGMGMDEETKQRVFEKFYQGDNSRATQGNGLGLTLAKRIVDLHNGTIAISSEAGKGTTFSVILPQECH